MNKIFIILIIFSTLTYANQLNRKCLSSSLNIHLSTERECCLISPANYDGKSLLYKKSKSVSDKDSSSNEEKSNPPKEQKQKFRWKNMLKRFFKGILKAF